MSANHSSPKARPGRRGLPARRIRLALLVVTLLVGTLLAIGLVGCGGSPRHTPPPGVSDISPSAPDHPVVQTALAQLDKPYRYGGDSPGGFDCSGLIYYAHRENGIAIPRTTREQQRQARPVSLTRLAPGDLLFFRQGRRKASHVGLYVGGGRFIHASTGRRSVALSSLSSPYWESHLVSAGRYLR